MIGSYSLRILAGIGGFNSADDNVDVEITLANGDVYAATFFTLTNLKKLMCSYKATGECASGLFFWASDMIIVENLTEWTIDKTVAELVNTGEIHHACTHIRVQGAPLKL